MGHIITTPTGTYRANWRDPAGQQRAKTFKTKKAARNFRSEVEPPLRVAPTSTLLLVGCCSGSTPSCGWPLGMTR